MLSWLCLGMVHGPRRAADNPVTGPCYQFGQILLLSDLVQCFFFFQPIHLRSVKDEVSRYIQYERYMLEIRLPFMTLHC